LIPREQIRQEIIQERENRIQILNNGMHQVRQNEQDFAHSVRDYDKLVEETRKCVGKIEEEVQLTIDRTNAAQAYQPRCNIM